ncbi:hypothetical protein M378DRAFT_122537 [Amanita muscaria Koide BX008]|uniref:PIN domain-like protein n=1 Tax=Amanita muscaria (strain Koide BX008) TaxID=946122 RepID=A0A0C2TKL9_AMAMK|nr:hypothetical protein M378DRAFT_122537 [Amanita muscaria Koide BX008]
MGVKSLWSLLAPVGRPILLETVEGKAMAIDSSIWIYQFQATMRDKEGRVLINAHVLGFLRRITKLLFYGIKPVFVFDGGAPAIKRNTLTERKRKKTGAVLSHARLAERLLAARLRKEALGRTHDISQGKAKPGGEDNIVYLEDVDPTIPKAPPRRDSPTPTPGTSSAKKKTRFYDHDPYRLPDVDLEATVAKATRSSVPDPRLATEDELRAFIEEMRPEDFDVNSPGFRELPTEVQYEIIGDLRLRSRQTSHARLEKMLRSSRTAMDFSKAQIQNLKQRNALTQQLLVTTDSIGKAHISIPVRIASERNKEYLLVKNDGVDGGWILGVRDGTREKPIAIDIDDTYADSDEDMEQVAIGTFGPVDDGSQKEMVPHHEGVNNKMPRVAAPLATTKKSQSKPLFDLDDDDQEIGVGQVPESDSENEMLSLAIQASLDDVQGTSSQVTSRTELDALNALSDIFVSPSRLETVLTFANVDASPSSSRTARNTSTSFGRPSLLSSFAPSDKLAVAAEFNADDGLDDAYIDVTTTPHVEHDIDSQTTSPNLISGEFSTPEPTANVDADKTEIFVDSDEDEDMEEVLPGPDIQLQLQASDENHLAISGTPEPTPNAGAGKTEIFVDSDEDEDMEEVLPEPHIQPRNENHPANLQHEVQVSPGAQERLQFSNDNPPSVQASPDGSDQEQIAWSRSPSPAAENIGGNAAVHPDDGWDAAQEMDPHAEEGEFARFMSQVKGKSIEEVRREIDAEIESLNQQRKAAMRDSEDITQQMITQIMTMLRLFGIPYVTAPMEAEAQCAELVSLGLVDGVITDDSDVFLFGAQRVFKNMFNQSKTVECFLLSDLSREVGLDRDTLVRLAYLLGSDYVEGLPGVGPVVAMELLKEFPGIDGLHKFKDWWLRVQSGRDTEEDTKSKFRKRFKKKFKNLYLDDDWPNSAVRDAYYHPTVDSSDEPFKWGLPDLDGLRQLFQQELGWEQAKIDELLLPVIHKINKRGQENAMNRQSNLSSFFDVSAGMGAYVPKKRQVYASRRLQDVVADFRKRQPAEISTPAAGSQEGTSQQEEAGEEVSGTRKRRKTVQKGRAAKIKKTVVSKDKRSVKRKKGTKRTNSVESEDEISESSASEVVDVPPSTIQLRPRRRRRKSAEPQTPGNDK